jgi:hypothetical protein
MAAPRLPRIRALTAGVDLESLDDLGPVERAIDRLGRARVRLEAEGFEVQLPRLALPPRLARLDPAAKRASLAIVRELDALAGAAGCVISVGPVVADDELAPGVAGWIADLTSATRHTFTSVVIASPEGGVHRQAARLAAEAMQAIAAATADGLGNFRFAAAARIPAGTPFFPVAHHHGAPSIAAGLESAHLVHDAVLDTARPRDLERRLLDVLGPPVMGIERILDGIAHDERIQYLGVDTSPAPLGDASIGAAIEALANAPFGDAGTLDACALITAAIRTLPVRTCGYCGLMLPVLEDEVLAARASEARFGIRELLLYSTVCGTGLDVVPIPGDTPVAALERLLLDVAALSTRLDKPLSARLLLAPGLTAGEMSAFDNEYLTNARVFAV